MLYTFLALCLAKGIMSIFLCVVLLVGFFNVLFLAGSSNRENRWSTSLSTLEIERHVLAGPMEKIKSQSFTELAG